MTHTGIVRSPTVAGIVALVLGGETEAGEAARRSLAAIEATNAAVNAVVGFDPGVIEPQVAALRARLEVGERPSLAGVPVTVKDHIRVANWPVTQGSRLFEQEIASEDDLVVRRLRQAGAILVGRTNMSEFGCKGVTTNRLFGPTRHPLDPSLTVGGSSGGAAASVAAGFVPLAIGSDGGGSARRPAAHCGIVGFKPSAGAIPEPRTLSQTGVLAPMGGCVEDVTRAFEALRGRDARDPFSLDLPVDESAAYAPLRIAYAPSFGLPVPVDPDIRQAIRQAVERIAGFGHRMEEASPVWPEGADEAGLMPIQHAALAFAHGDRWRRDPDLFDPDIAVQIEAGLSLPGADVAKALALGTAIAGITARFFASGFDLLIGPTTPCTAWPLDRLGPNRIDGVPVGPRAHAAFTPFFNHALCPAISIPAGRDRHGLPIGLQLVGPRLSDTRLLAVAARVETLLAG